MQAVVAEKWNVPAYTLLKRKFERVVNMDRKALQS